MADARNAFGCEGRMRLRVPRDSCSGPRVETTHYVSVLRGWSDQTLRKYRKSGSSGTKSETDDSTKSGGLDKLSDLSAGGEEHDHLALEVRLDEAQEDVELLVQSAHDVVLDELGRRRALVLAGTNGHVLHVSLRVARVWASRNVSS